RFALDDRRPSDIVFDEWVAVTGRRAASTKFTPKRKHVVIEALKLYGLADTLDAVRGWQHSPFHCGQNDRGTVYNDLEFLLRDARNIERFRDLEQRGPSVPPPVMSKGRQNLDRLFER